MSAPLTYDEELRKQLVLVKATGRYERVIDKPGGAGPSGRRLHKDDDGSLVARITYRTGERFISRSFKAPDKTWTVRLLSEDQAHELGRVNGLPMDKGLHRQIIEFLIRREYGRRRADT